jgi:glucose-1-phosphate adenylyltransferase
VGTLDAYNAASMDLVSGDPALNLHNMLWPILTWNEPLPPAKFLTPPGGRPGRAHDSIVSGGVIVSGAAVDRSLLFPGVRVHPGARVEDSVLMNDVDVGSGAEIRGAIIDKKVRVPDGARIGTDLDADRDRYVVSAEGVVVIGKGQEVR